MYRNGGSPRHAKNAERERFDAMAKIRVSDAQKGGQHPGAFTGPRHGTDLGRARQIGARRMSCKITYQTQKASKT